MNIYHCVTKDGYGLSVGVDEWGVSVADLNPLDEISEDGYRYLVKSMYINWDKFFEHKSCYSQDNGTGPLRTQIVNRAISCLAYGPTEDYYLKNKKDFKKAE